MVHEHINHPASGRPLAYTTILTVMRNLTRRGFLSQNPQGRSHLFAPLIDEHTFKLEMLRQLRRDLFAGQAEDLLDYLAKDDEVEADLRNRLAAFTRHDVHA